MSESLKATYIDDLTFMIVPQINPWCGPIFFTKSMELWTGNHVTAHGSFGLVNTGEKKLMVTCYHVWEEFQNARQEFADLKMCIGLSPEGILTLDAIQPIDEDPKLDLVSFDIGASLKECGHTEFASLDFRHPPPIKKRDLLVLVGFPGRLEADTNIGVQFVRIPYALAIYDLNDRYALANMTNVKPIKPQVVGQTGHRGGLSGSPCYVLRPNYGVQLAGFVTSEAMELLRITLATRLNADGTIRH
jgi:hypothetical protein